MKTPQTRVKAFIRDWHKAWTTCGSGIIQHHDYDFFERWRDVLNSELTPHVTAKDAFAEDTSHYGSPPVHDPAQEELRKVVEEGRRATVETKIGHSYFEYELTLNGDEWLISRVHHFFHDESQVALQPTELEALLASTTINAALPPLSKGDSPNCMLLFQDGLTFSVEDWVNARDGSPCEIKQHKISVNRIGILSLPSGKLVVRDFGYGLDDARPLSRSVPPGDYPVEISATDQACAAIRVVFIEQPKEPFTYHPAPTVDDTDGHGTVGVDGGRAAICDAAGFLGRSCRQHEQDVIRRNEKLSQRPYSASLFMSLSGGANPDVVDIVSGHGDGGYPCYWVIDAEGRTASLVLDFMIVGQSLKRTYRQPWQKNASGTIFEKTTPEGKEVSVVIDRTNSSAIARGDVERIIWLDKSGDLLGDTTRLGSYSNEEERGWRLQMSKLDQKATSFEVVVRAGYCNGGGPLESFPSERETNGPSETKDTIFRP